MFEQSKTMWAGYVWSSIKHLDDGFAVVTFKPQPKRDISLKIKSEDLSDLVMMLTCAEENVEGGCFTLYDDGTLCINDPEDVSSALCSIKTYGMEYEEQASGGRVTLSKSVMLEYLCVRDSAVLCDKLIQSLLKWEEISGERLSEDTKLALDHLLKTLRRGEAEFIDMLGLEEQK